MESLPPQDSNQAIPSLKQPLLHTQQAALQHDDSVRQLATVSFTSTAEMNVIDIEDQAEEVEFSVAGRPEDGKILDSIESLSTTAQGTTSPESVTEEIQQDDISAQIPQVTPSDEEEVSPHVGEDDIKSIAPELQSMEPVIPSQISASVEYEGDTVMTISSLDASEVPKPKMKPNITLNQRPMAQCRRLYSCIQAAASKLDDATKDRSTQRVTRLTKLIPRDPAHHIGN